jgi:hypothetical protein
VIFVTYKWRSPVGYRSTFTAQHVNVWRNMIRRHYEGDAEFVCITDDATGIDPGVRVIPLWDHLRKLPSPHGNGNPACYPRLYGYSVDMAEIIGPRFCVTDLDLVVLGERDSMNRLVDVPDDFKIWGDTAKGTPYNGSLTLMTAGARRQVWEQFDPVQSPARARALGYIGSDQAWIGACLGTGEKKWTKADGVYSYRNEIAPRGVQPLPQNARIVVFHGFYDPWHPTMRAKHEWVRRFYR